MNIKEIIRAEIKRLIADPTLCSTTERKIGGHTALLKLVDFLDTLPEQSVEGLEEEISRYLREKCSSDNEPSVSEIARHFAEWGAEHLKK